MVFPGSDFMEFQENLMIYTLLLYLLNLFSENILQTCIIPILPLGKIDKSHLQRLIDWHRKEKSFHLRFDLGNIWSLLLHHCALARAHIGCIGRAWQAAPHIWTFPQMHFKTNINKKKYWMLLLWCWYVVLAVQSYLIFCLFWHFLKCILRQKTTRLNIEGLFTINDADI